MFKNNPEAKFFFNDANQATSAQSRALANADVAYATNIDKLENLSGAVDLIAAKQLLATTDNCLACWVQTANQTFDLIDQGVNSTATWLSALGLPELPLSYPAVLITADAEGHVLSTIMPGYRKGVAAFPESGAGPIRVISGWGGTVSPL